MLEATCCEGHIPSQRGREPSLEESRAGRNTQHAIRALAEASEPWNMRLQPRAGSRCSSPPSLGGRAQLPPFPSLGLTHQCAPRTLGMDQGGSTAFTVSRKSAGKSGVTNSTKARAMAGGHGWLPLSRALETSWLLPELPPAHGGEGDPYP